MNKAIQGLAGMHPLLQSQMQRHLDADAQLSAPLTALLEAVNTSYEMHQIDAARLTRAASTTAAELTASRENEAALRRSLAFLRETLNSTADGILVVGTDRRVHHYNDTFLEMWEMPPALMALGDEPALLEFAASQLIDPHRFLQTAARLYASTDKNFDLVELKDGRAYERYSQPCFLEQELIGRVWTFRDITDRYQAERELAYLTNYDELTGLPNRNLLRDRLHQAVKKSARDATPFALMFLDLDNFKNINDTLGHQHGDQILKDAVQRIFACIRNVDTLARLGGDEYAVIIENLHKPDDAAKVASKILESFELPFNVDGQEVFCTASIGVTVFPVDATGIDDMIKNADSAMYQAKESGKNNFQFYTPILNLQAQERLLLENKLRRALEKNEFVLHYQPKIDLVSGRIVGLEALIRWNDPAAGLIPPLKFIPILEDTGMIGAVGLWVLKEACRFNKWLQTTGVATLRVSVNLSARQFRQERLVSEIEGILRMSELQPCYLELEITESLLADPHLALPVLARLREIGVTLSIDDFGTGYSSLSYLQRFPIDTLKIDRSFIRDIGLADSEIAITNAIIALGKSLKLGIIAEGVETQAQLEYLQRQGCDEVQGFLFAKPMPEAELVAWIRNASGTLPAASLAAASADDKAAGTARPVFPYASNTSQ